MLKTITATVIVVPAAIASIGAVLWLGRDSGALILLGLAVGVLVLLWPATARAAARPLVKLTKTARPLLLPLLVAIAVGTVKYSAAVQVLAGATLLVVAWRLIVVPEARKSGVDLRWQLDLLKKIAANSLGAMALGVLIVFVVRRIGLDNPYFEAIGDIASGLLLLAVVLWVIAFALRLFSYATTPLRAALAAAIGLALLALAAGAGILPGRGAIGDEWLTVAGGFGVLALALLVVEVARSVVAGTDAAHRSPAPGAQGVDTSGSEKRLRRRERYAARLRGCAAQPTRCAARLGFSAASVAAAVLAVSTGYGLVAAADRGGPLNPPQEESADARRLPPGATAGEGGLELSKRYAPVLVFAKGERWAPIRVDSYVADATLSGPPGTPERVETVAELPRSCPEFGQSRCYELSIGCDSGGEPCARGSEREEGRLYRDGAVYVRVLRKGRRLPEEPRGAFIERGPYRDRLQTLIQYWYFYRYNEWRAPVFAGLLIQRHEADWEAVTIGFDAAERPLFVADSAHCAGSWSPWREVEASTLLPGPRTHPLVAVAEGSHANYPDPDEKRSPDWASCAGAPAGATTAISFASNIRDRTGYGWLWYPPDDGWIAATATTAPMSFPGTWGADDRVTLRNFRSHQLGEGPAPATPTLQPLWREPVKTIFCGRYKPRICTRDGE